MENNCLEIKSFKLYPKEVPTTNVIQRIILKLFKLKLYSETAIEIIVIVDSTGFVKFFDTIVLDNGLEFNVADMDRISNTLTLKSIHNVINFDDKYFSPKFAYILN